LAQNAQQTGRQETQGKSAQFRVVLELGYLAFEPCRGGVYSRIWQKSDLAGKQVCTGQLQMF